MGGVVSRMILLWWRGFFGGMDFCRRLVKQQQCLFTSIVSPSRIRRYNHNRGVCVCIMYDINHIMIYIML